MALTREQYQKKGMFLAVFPPAVVVVGLWVIYATRAVFGLDLLNRVGREPASATFYLWLALGGTVFAAAWAGLAAQKASGLMKYGVTTEGKVTGQSLLRRAGKRPTTVTYGVGGVKYSTKRDLDSGLKVGDAVTVLCDSRKPSRCVVL